MMAIEKTRRFGTRFCRCFDRYAIACFSHQRLCPAGDTNESGIRPRGERFPAKREFEKVTPAVWAAIVAAMLAIAIWFAMKL
jgi:hypothetical protein